MLRISGLNLPLEGGLPELKKLAAKRLRIKPESILKLSLHKKSLDARKKEQLHFICTVDVVLACPEEPLLAKRASDGVSRVTPYFYSLPVKKAPALPPVVVGSGPCGLFAALILAEGGQRPLVLERGADVDSRLLQVRRLWEYGLLDEECNVQFGEGGAGTFSDGKLQSGIRDTRLQKLFEEMAACGAPQEILYQNKPHIGTDHLHTMVKNLRQKIIALGGEVRFGAKLIDLSFQDGVLRGLTYLQHGAAKELAAEKLVLAIGHSARDTFEMLLKKGVVLSQKPFAVGLRIEHSQRFIDAVQYGVLAGHPALGAADYKLAVRLPDDTGVYTFCMCPGGRVIAAASEAGHVTTNGMSAYARAERNANSAVLAEVKGEDLQSGHPLAGIAFQRKLESAAFQLGGGGYRAPVQLVGDFLQGRASTDLGAVIPSYAPGYALAELSRCLNPRISACLRLGIAEMDKRLPGFASPEAVLTGVESRSSSPVRILRGPDGQALALAGLYPAGEGAGYAGGIVSAAVDGMRAAEHILAAT